jgi:tRNA pseudouridine38-40 synthase
VDAPETRRFALLLHYDGAPFHGWQLQPAAPTVQGEVERALARITGGDPVRVIGSGRTDRGVHATGQVAAVDLPPRWTAPELRRSLNALLPDSIWIEEVRRVPPGFHPRFDARRRSYRYQVGTSPAARSPHLRRVCWPTDPTPPDPGLLAEGAALLPGDRSFRAFARAGQEWRGDRCQLHEASWVRWFGGDGEPLGLAFHVTANRYLHHMVRYLVGTMVAVGRGERPMSDLASLLEDPDTPLVTSPPAPPEGLFLTRVEYEEDSIGHDPDRDTAGAPPSEPVAAPGRPQTATDERTAR